MVKVGISCLVQMPLIGKIISDSCSPAKNNPRNGFSEKKIFGPPLLQDYQIIMMEKSISEKNTEFEFINAFPHTNRMRS